LIDEFFYLIENETLVAKFPIVGSKVLQPEN